MNSKELVLYFYKFNLMSIEFKNIFLTKSNVFCISVYVIILSFPWILGCSLSQILWSVALRVKISLSVIPQIIIACRIWIPKIMLMNILLAGHLLGMSHSYVRFNAMLVSAWSCASEPVLFQNILVIILIFVHHLSHWTIFNSFKLRVWWIVT